MENSEEIKKVICEKLPHKTIRIFEAVLALRNEGVDLNNLTVAEIAKKAGIGKGTVYDYLSSKEEIIVKALAYEYCLQVYEFDYNIRKEVKFEEQVEAAFRWVEDNMRKSFFLMRLVQVDQSFMKLGREFCESLFPNISKPEAFNDTIDYVLSTGAKENKIRYPKDNLERDMVINAIGGALFAYLMAPEKYVAFEYTNVKEYAKEFLFRLLA